MRKKFFIFLGVAGLAVLGQLLVQRAKPHPLPTLGPPQTEEPTITWSVSTLTGTIFPGTSSTTVVTFRSNQNLAGVVVEATPSLDGILSVSPMSFASLAANQSYQLTLTLKAPPEFKKREFGGTIHIRNNGKPPKTYAQPLTVNLRTDWNIFTDSTNGFSLHYPPNWLIWPTSPSGGVVLSNVGPDTQRNPASMAGVCKIQLATIQKPATVPLQEWLLKAHNEQGGLPPISLTPITVGSFTGLREVTGEIGLVDTVYLSFSQTTVFSAALIYGNDVQNQCESMFDKVVSTIAPQ